MPPWRYDEASGQWVAEPGAPAPAAPPAPPPPPPWAAPTPSSAAPVAWPDQPDPAVPDGRGLRTLRGFPRRRAGWTVVLDIVLWLALGLLGLGILLQALMLAGVLEIPGGELDAGDVARESLFGLVLMGAIPLAWAFGTRASPAVAAAMLRLRGRWSDLGWGALAWLAIFLGLLAVSLVLDAIGIEEGNPVVEELMQSMTVPYAIVIALCAALGEEILFRGVLQRSLGIWGQAAAFGIVHLGYGTYTQVLFPFALGVGFGYMTRWRRSIWPAVVAHFLVDFVAFEAGMYCRDNPAACGM